MNNAELFAKVTDLGQEYMDRQANAASIPTFKADLADLLGSEDLPERVIDRLLQGLDVFASYPHTSSTTFPYLSTYMVSRIKDYFGVKASSIPH